MKRIVLAILLDVVATIAMLFFVVLPSVMPIDNVPGMRPLLQSLLCERGETINVESHTYTRPGRVSTSANFYCVREAGAQREVTGKAVLIAIAGFTIPLVISIFLFISGGASMKKKRFQTNADAILQGFGLSSSSDPNAFGAGFGDDGQGMQADRMKKMNVLHWGTMREGEVKSMLEGMGISIDDNPGAFQSITTSMGVGTLVERLKTLKDAYDQGLITESEYETKRKDILGEM